jgi:flagellar hook-associated protein 2
MASPITASGSIDVQGMVSALMRAERKPLEQMQAESKKIDAKISAYGRLQSQVAAFRDAAAALSRPDTWRAVKAQSANAAAVEVTARPGAAASRHAIEVQQLAQPQTVFSGAFARGDAVVGGGTLTIELGTQPPDGQGFAPDAARSTPPLTLAAGATLADVRDAINRADAGVRASIVKDGERVRLLLTGRNPGSDQAFRIVASDDGSAPAGGPSLSSLAVDPADLADPERDPPLGRPATDARYSLDGLPLTARSNRITDAMSGVDFVLRQVTSAPVELEVSVDVAAFQAATKTFVDAYNALNTLLVEQTRFDGANKTAAPLQGDRSAVGLLGQVRSIVRETVAGGTLTRLSDVGIALQRDGSLKLSNESLSAAAAEPSRLQALFAATGTDATDRGLMLRFRDLADRMIGSDGTVQTATQSWQARKTANQRRQDALQIRLSDVEKRLLRQYTALDAQLAAAQQSSAALANALAALPKL